MATSLYDLSVTTYLQTLTAVSRYLERGSTHCRDNGLDLEAIVDTRIFSDMLPFRFQIQSVVHHSVGATEALNTGIFLPAGDKTSYDYPGLQGLVQEALTRLQALTPEEINAREIADVTFQVGEHKLLFSAADFVLSFSLPNFHFHATTAYDILRSKGVPLGKRDYLGRLRLKR